MASAELRDTRRRIRSVQATAKITRAMELIAASRIPKAQARVTASKPYTTKLIEVIRNVGKASGSASHMLLEDREVKTVGVLVISADRGLAGAYASSIIRMAEAAMIAHRRAGREVRLFAVGKKANSYFDYRGYAIERSFLGVTDTPGYGDARAIAATVMEAYAAGRVDAVEAYSTHFQSLLTQTPSSSSCSRCSPPGPTIPIRRWPTPTNRTRRRSWNDSFPGTSRPSSTTCCWRAPPPSTPPAAGR